MSARRRGLGMSTVTSGSLKTNDFTLDERTEGRHEISNYVFPTQCGSVKGVIEGKGVDGMKSVIGAVDSHADSHPHVSSPMSAHSAD